MKPYTMLRLVGLLLLGILLAGCGGGGDAKVDVQATVDAAIAATATAQGRLQMTVDAAVAATQAARSVEPVARVDVTATPGVAIVTEPIASPTAPLTEPPSPTATQAPDTPTPFAPRCEVISAGLNLRPGPGTIYDPPLRGLARGAVLTPVSFIRSGFPSGQWVEIQVVAGGQRGWVSAGAQFVRCNVDVSSLPVGVAPPTPTPTRVQVTLPPPPATPTRVAPVAVLPVDGGGDGSPIRNGRNVKGGRNVLLPGFESSEISTPMVFRDRIVFQVEVFDSNVGQTDGAGIDTVSFEIADSQGLVHERTERNAGYCVFGGGEPTCEVWRFSQHNNQWPNGSALNYGLHNLRVIIRPKSGAPVEWYWTFQMERP